MKLAHDIVIVDYLRSPFSKASFKAPEKDLLNGYHMDEVLGMLWKEIVKRTKIDPKIIDEAAIGVARPVLENFTFGGKYPTFLRTYLLRWHPSRSTSSAVPHLML